MLVLFKHGRTCAFDTYATQRNYNYIKNLEKNIADEKWVFAPHSCGRIMSRHNYIVPCLASVVTKK